MKKAQATGKIVREIMVAAKMGGPDMESNARLSAAVQKARKESVSRDVIERAIKKGAGTGAEKLVLEHVLFEGYAPNKVPVIVEVYTDNVNRTAPEVRTLFRKGQLGSAGSNKFLFDPSSIVEGYHPDPDTDIEAVRQSKPAPTRSNRSPTSRTTTFPPGRQQPVFSPTVRPCIQSPNGCLKTAGRSLQAKSGSFQKHSLNSPSHSAPRPLNSSRNSKTMTTSIVFGPRLNETPWTSLGKF